MYLKFGANRYILEVIQFIRGVGMAINSNQEITNVTPYDDTLWDRYSIYDMIPYTWNADLNVEKIFEKTTGNIIKAYRCIIKAPFEIRSK